MTDTIEKLRKLAEAATPGPWDVDQDDFANYVCSPGEDAIVAEPDRAEDTAFIVAMRNALPALLDLVEAADSMRRRGSLVNYNDYDTKRAALAKALEATDG